MFNFDQWQSKGNVYSDITALKQFPVPERPNTTRWQGIQFYDLAETVNEKLNGVIPLGNSQFSFDITAQKWTVYGKEHTELAGVLDLSLKRDGQEIQAPDGVQYSLAVAHSNMSRKALEFYVSARVLVCANGMVANRAMDKVSKKHTQSLSVPRLVVQGLTNYISRIGQVNNQIRDMQEKEISQSDYNNVLVASARRGIIPWSGLGKVDKEWNEPRHTEFVPRNLWSLYNCYTEVAKEMSPDNQIRTVGGVRWAFSDAGLMGLPEHAQFA